MVRHANVATQHVATPTIMVARDPQDFDASLARGGHRRERAESGAGHHVPPLKPEVEDVAVEDHAARVAPGEIEQRDERMFNLWRGGAKVRVGGDQAGRRQHAPFNLARRVPLYKGRHRF